MKHFKFTRWCACFIFLMALYLPNNLIAQNFCGCIGNTIATPSVLHPDINCMTLFDENDLDDLTPCSGDFVFYVIDPTNGDTITFDTNSVMVDLKPYIGDILLVSVFDMGSDSTCSSYYEIIDDTPPMLTCPSDTLVCTLYPDSVLSPIIVEDCGIVNLSVPVDSVVNLNCAGGLYRRIFRDYTATDEQGNVATCQQIVLISKSDLLVADLGFPKDTILNCGASIDVSITGSPTLDGIPFVNNQLCNIQLFMEEDTNNLNCGDQLILRRWVFVDDCDPNIMVADTQLIKLVDTIPPVFVSCSPLFTFNADQSCMASPTVPAPLVTDNCSLVEIRAFSSVGEGVLTPGGFLFSGLAEGIYPLEFVATDSCGNVATCFSSIQIVDVTTPTAVCDGDLTITLDNMGNGILQAINLDEGSNDACGGPLNFQISRDGINFSNFVTFDCDDALVDSVLVTLLVIDATNPTSTNICMVGVTVVDKTEPSLICPLPVTIDCGTDISNLSVFGVPPVLFDACMFTVELDSMIDIGQCGSGLITRMWTVRDTSGNESFCSQEITVANQTPFNGAGIVWPADYTVINACALPEDLEPTDLPAGFDAPVVPADPCAMIATSYKDQLFYIDFPACYKIVRTWKVVDWCQATPANPLAGIWQDQQVIAIMDTTPPTITSCPAPDTVGLDATCTFGQVFLTPVSATAHCANEDITITNDSPYAFANGANASGNYPEGVHLITFKVKDGCGNSVNCSVTVVVTDLKQPTPFCKDGIVAELQFMPNAVPEIMAVVNASQLNYNSFDNCTASSNLTYTMRPLGANTPTVPSTVYGCGDEGDHEVEIWVTDESGNSDFCITEITIQDNMDLCPDTLSVGNGVIGGGIQTQMGELFPDVHVDIAAMNMSYMTDNQGKYEFGNLPVGSSYTIEPWKNDDPKNGVTTYDIVVITRHILSIQPMDDPYKLIAADINNSGSITTFDIVQLRKLILGVYQNFPDNNSWRFVRADYVFPNPVTPSDPPYPEVMNVANLNSDIMNADFVGVKIGDVNGSATANFGGQGTDDRATENLNILLEDQQIEAGETFTVPFWPAKDIDLLALQFTLEFETDLELQGIEKGTLSGVAGDRFVTSQIADGIMTGTWYHTSPVLTTPEDALFSLRFTSKRAGMLSEMIFLTSSYTEALAYDEREIPLNLNLEFNNPTNMQTNISFQLFQNQPNPFKRVTNIAFTLPETGPAKLTVFDVSGNVLKTYSQVYQAGYNEVSIMRQELPVGGVLFYQLQTPTHNETKKMILLQ